MPDLLTESFCERCGARYTFDRPSADGIGQRVSLLVRALRTYVLSDDTSLAEALAEARSARQRELSSQQLEAFHEVFSFCLSCRQYVCRQCWNSAESRCLTCAPALGREVLPPPLPQMEPPGPIRPVVPGGGHEAEEEVPAPAPGTALTGGPRPAAPPPPPEPVPAALDPTPASAPEEVGAPVAAASGALSRPARPATVWASSSRDVLGRSVTGVQACVACGLPVSATARFCRRCGTPQGRA